MRDEHDMADFLKWSESTLQSTAKLPMIEELTCSHLWEAMCDSFKAVYDDLDKVFLSSESRMGRIFCAMLAYGLLFLGIPIEVLRTTARDSFAREWIGKRRLGDAITSNESVRSVTVECASR